MNLFTKNLPQVQELWWIAQRGFRHEIPFDYIWLDLDSFLCTARIALRFPGDFCEKDRAVAGSGFWRFDDVWCFGDFCHRASTVNILDLFRIIVQSIHPFQAWMQYHGETSKHGGIGSSAYRKPVGLVTQDSCKCGPAQFENIRKGGHWLLVVLVNTFLLLNHQKQTWGLNFDTLGGSRSLGAYQWDWDWYSYVFFWESPNVILLLVQNFGYTKWIYHNRIGCVAISDFWGAGAELRMGNLHRNGCFQTDSGTSSNLFYLYSLFKPKNQHHFVKWMRAWSTFD